MRILGIDPGTAILGYGILDYQGNQFKLVEYGCVRTEAGTPLPERLHIIYQELDQIIRTYRPDTMAVEELFFTNNVTTAISVSHARGVVLLLGKMYDLTLGEYTPPQVKQGVTGYGRAAKKQVQEMVKIILSMKDIPRPDDAADALAVAICHGHSSGKLGEILRGKR